MNREEVSTQNVMPFVAKDVFGNTVDLLRVTKDYTLLAFLRYAGCPLCNLAIHRLTIEYKRLEAQSCQIIAIVQSDKDSIMENIYDRHDPQPQFPIIPDREMKLYKQYGVKTSLVKGFPMIHDIPFWLQSVTKLGYKQGKVDGSLFLVPAWFLINNKTGEIVKSEQDSSFYDQNTFTKIYDSLEFKD